MFRSFRSHLTYANVMVTLLAIVTLAGGTAYAAAQLAPNSVNTASIQNGAVTTPKLHTNAVVGSKVKNGSLSAADINPATLHPHVVWGSANKASSSVKTILNLKSIGLLIRTDGDTDTSNQVGFKNVRTSGNINVTLGYSQFGVNGDLLTPGQNDPSEPIAGSGNGDELIAVSLAGHPGVFASVNCFPSNADNNIYCIGFTSTP